MVKYGYSICATVSNCYKILQVEADGDIVNITYHPSFNCKF